MRSSLLCLAAAVAALAQAPPPGSAPRKSLDDLLKSRVFPPGPARVCSIPLLRVPIEPKAYTMKIIPVAPDRWMPQVKVPAPPCDEPEKRRR
jgi:hypothetical protein